MSVISHVSAGVTDMNRSSAFYDAVLATLNLKRIKVIPNAADPQQPPSGIGYGRYYPQFWLHPTRAVQRDCGIHFAFAASSIADVNEFHRVALANGATDAGAPGPRPQYFAGYYAAFVLDPDGNKIEATFVDMGIWNYCAVQ